MKNVIIILLRYSEQRRRDTSDLRPRQEDSSRILFASLTMGERLCYNLNRNLHYGNGRYGLRSL